MMDRRSFLRRTSLALPALLVGDAALEAFERLSHRKVFALGDIPLRGTYYNRLAPPGVMFYVNKYPDRAIVGYGAVVRESNGRVTDYKKSTGVLYSSGWSTREDMRKELAFQMMKLGQKVSKEHNIPFDTITPTIAQALS